MKQFAPIIAVDDIRASGSSLYYDYCLFSKGKEDRAYTLQEHYSDIIKADRLVLFDSRRKHESLSADDIAQYNRIEKLLERRDSIDYQVVSVEDSKFGAILSERKIKTIPRVAIDVSSMNFWEMSDIIYYFIRIANSDILDIFYTEPDVYRYQEDNITKYSNMLSTVSFNYPHNYMSTKTTQESEIFVAVIGFQKNVLKLMRDLYDVSDLYSINGFPSFYPKAKDISQTNNADYLLEVKASHRYSSEASNPFICFNTLCDIKKESGGAFMTLCPLGSKPMTLGACLYALKNQSDTRIVYPFSEAVGTETDGIGRTYCYRISKDFFNQ